MEGVPRRVGRERLETLNMHTFPVLLEGKEEAGQQLEGKVGSQPFFFV